MEPAAPKPSTGVPSEASAIVGKSAGNDVPTPAAAGAATTRAAASAAKTLRSTGHTSGVDEEQDELGNADRLRSTLALDRRGERRAPAAGRVLDAEHLEGRADPASGGQRRGKADAVDAVVHEREPARRRHVVEQRHHERERQEP